MLKLPQNYIMDSDCCDILLDHIKNYIIYYYCENKLFEQSIDVRLGNKSLKIIYNKHFYFVTIVKINNIIHYYLKCTKKEPIILIYTSPKVFDTIIKSIKNMI